MNGPDHYRAAEALVLNAATRIDAGSAQRMLAEAQVHATLALVASFVEGMGPEVQGAGLRHWEKVVGS